MGYTKLNNDCIMFRKTMSAYIDDQTGDAETRALTDHVASCPLCKKELSNHYIIRDMVKSTYAPKGEVDFSDSIMMKLNPEARHMPVAVSRNISGKIIRYGVVAALFAAALGSTVLYSQSQTRKMMAEKRKFDTYVVEHATQYAGQPNPVAASVISVNFEK